MATRKVRKFDVGGATGRTIVQPGPGTSNAVPGMGLSEDAYRKGLSQREQAQLAQIARQSNRVAADAARQAGRTDMLEARNKMMWQQNPERMYSDVVSDAYRDARRVGFQYVPGTPERQNFENYYRSLPNDKDVVAQGVATQNYAVPKLAAFDPTKTYAAPVRTPDTNKPMKSGGKAKAYKAGGAVKASKRADGIAQRGKTKGRMV